MPAIPGIAYCSLLLCQMLPAPLQCDFPLGAKCQVPSTRPHSGASCVMPRCIAQSRPCVAPAAATMPPKTRSNRRGPYRKVKCAGEFRQPLAVRLFPLEGEPESSPYSPGPDPGSIPPAACGQPLRGVYRRVTPPPKSGAPKRAEDRAARYVPASQSLPAHYPTVSVTRLYSIRFLPTTVALIH